MTVLATSPTVTSTGTRLQRRRDTGAAPAQADGGAASLRSYTGYRRTKTSSPRPIADGLASFRELINGIDVAPSGARTDPEVTHAVRSALERDIVLRHDRIRATVCGGWVTLEGSVPNYFQRTDSGNIVRRLAGVHGVTNSLRVEAYEDRHECAHDAIRGALNLLAGREAAYIVGCFRNGTLTVPEQMRSWAENRMRASTSPTAVGAETSSAAAC